ncbi:MAG: 5-(carboxyamino)imidazole ribonucleotide synthase, partial [Herbaspirillum sp.]
LPGAKLHLYGKSEPRRGRKMGHITFIAPDLAAAQHNLRRACEILRLVV